MLTWILHPLLLATVIYFLAEQHSRIHIKNFWTAVLVAVVYSLINLSFGLVLKLVSLPLILLSVGLFLLVINMFLLWITDKLIDNFEIEDKATLILAAIVITITDTLLTWFF
jgi:putative membrane protein